MKWFFWDDTWIMIVSAIITVSVIVFSANRLANQQGSPIRKVDTLTVRRTLPNLSSAEAYRRCLGAWREKNLGLWLLPPAMIWQRGNEDTGEGLIMIRIPPAGLLEGIVKVKAPTTTTNKNEMSKAATTRADNSHAIHDDDQLCKDDDDDDDDDDYWMEYKVLNPSIVTWPVHSHRGFISFRQKPPNTNDNDQSISTELEWNVEWEPLPLVGNVVSFVTAQVVHCAVNCIASGR
jgi:hypothetical protein